MNDLLRNKGLAALFLASSLAACDGGSDDTTDTDLDTDADVTCTSGITSFYPDRDAADVFFRSAIEVVFTKDESTTATLTLTDGAGAAVAGTTAFSADGKTATFEPSADLAPSTSYTLSVAYSCDKTADATFTTSSTGAAVDGNSVLGNVYNIDLASGRIVKPAGVGSILEPLIADAGVSVLVSPTELNGTDLTMVGALGDEAGMQDMCQPTIVFPLPADYTGNPFFTISGENVPLSVSGFTITLGSIDLSGAFKPDGSGIDGLSLEGSIDTKDLGALLDLGDDPNAVCGLVSGFGVQCEACPDGSGTTCLSLEVQDLEAPESSATITPLVQADIDANADCAAQ